MSHGTSRLAYLHRVIDAAITEYMGLKPDEVKFVADPHVSGTYGVRVTTRHVEHDFIIHLSGNAVNQETIEEVEFTSWPPTSGGN